MTRLFLVRHGETNWNLEKRFGGRSDEARLTEKGKEQVRLLRKRLATEHIDALYCSPLTRALDTAKIIKPDGVEIQIHPDLIERDFGDVDGMKSQEYRDAHPELYDGNGGYYLNDLPGVKGLELFADVRKRGLRVLKEIAEKETGTVLIVTHGTLLRAIFTSLMGTDSTDRKSLPGNCSLSILNYEAGKFTVELFNDLSHEVTA